MKYRYNLTQTIYGIKLGEDLSNKGKIWHKQFLKHSLEQYFPETSA